MYFLVSLHLLMRSVKKICFVVGLLLISATCMAQSFFVTKNISCNQKGSGKASYSAKIEFPVDGDARVLNNVREWICDILEVECPKRLDEDAFRALLMDVSGKFLFEVEDMSRQIEVERCFEDENCVTFEATIVDVDSEKWTSQDCATFSKRDGHRLQVNEIFNCNEDKIKELMWEYRGDLPMEVGCAEELVVGNVGFIDGWIIVIGPAHHYTGAAYRIRYEEVEQYIKKGISGGYH